MTVEVEAPDDVTDAQMMMRVKERVGHSSTRRKILVRKVTVEDSSPVAGVQAAFIYDSGGHSPCHAVVKKKNGPWSENRFGFCGVEPVIGPVGSIDSPDGGLCHTCAKFVSKGDDGNWYVRKDVPIPGPKVRASLDCGGCFDD
jgi:hypothetical protein